MTGRLDVGKVWFPGKRLTWTGLHHGPDPDLRNKTEVALSKMECQKENRISSPFGILLRVFRSNTLEGQAQPETDQTAVVDTLLIEARINSSKVFIARNVGDWEESSCSLVHVETKAAQFREIHIER